MYNNNPRPVPPRRRWFREDIPLEVRMREKRRGPRMNSCVPVHIEWSEKQKPSALEEEAQTRVVNFYGCLLVSKASMPVEQRMKITNLATRQSIGAVVVWQGKKGVDGWELGVELLEPKNDFWGVEL